MKSLKFGDTEAQFGQRLEALRSEAAVSVVPNKLTLETAQIAEASPVGAIMEAWANIERKIRSIAKVSGVSAEEIDSLRLLSILQQKKIISDASVRSLNGLKSLRNLAAHSDGHRPTVQQALEFTTMAEAMLSTLDIETSNDDTTTTVG